MKCFFTLMILMVVSFAKGQVVNIPDSNFKNYLLSCNPVIDTNHDGEIQTTEAEAVLEINTNTTGLFDLIRPINDITGIRSFTNLKSLTWHSASRLRSFDISGLNKLTFLWASGDSLVTVNLTGCINLDTVYFSVNPFLTSLDFSGNNKIRNLQLLGSTFNINIPFILGQQDSLKHLELHKISGINDTIDLKQYKNLQFFRLWYTNYKSIDLAGLDKFETLDISAQLTYDNFQEINLNGCRSFRALISPSTIDELKKIDLTNCTSLTGLSLWNCQISSLDISTCYNLRDVSVRSPYLKKIDLKNGIVNNLDLGMLRWDTTHIDICTDEFETEIIRNTTPVINVNITPYCTFFPGGTYNTIKGMSRIDENNNGCDSTDRGLANVTLKISDTSGFSVLRYTAPSGEYAFYPFKGVFTVQPYFPYPYFTISPATASVTFDTANSLIATKDFCIQPNGTHNDLEISFLPTWPPAKPGFDAAYTLVYKNRGTTTLNGSVAVNFDNNKMNFVSASENVTTQSSGQLQWNYSNLQPFESRTINVTFNLLPPPVNNIGDTISYLAVITPSDNDETAFDNIFILPQRVIGSFDPNDKQCLEGSKLDISKIGDYLHYQIRFQNEGTDTAFNIVVADTLSDNLDWSSFEFISSSHTCNPVLKNNKLEFFFPNINLPYKAIDEPGSNGWVAFKIKPKPSVVIGDSINNTAAIYFDFNLPVITNKATTVVSSASTPVPVKLEYFSINKKENSNQLNWKASCTYGNAIFVIERSDDGIHFNAIGNINATSLRCQLPFNFMDNNPAAGKNYYRLRITDADGKSFYSKTLVIGNNKAGIEITGVANNTIYLNSNKQQTIAVRVIASDGREIANQKQTISAGNNNISLQMKNTAKGIFILIIYSDEGETITKRFSK